MADYIDSFKVDNTEYDLRDRAAVRYDTAQTLTDEQKTQARENIGAGAPVTVDAALSDTSENPVQNKVIKEALDGKAAAAHSHDERYYTEAEVNTLLAAKAPAYTYGTDDLTAGTSALTTGTLYFVYE